MKNLPRLLLCAACGTPPESADPGGPPEYVDAATGSQDGLVQLWHKEPRRQLLSRGSWRSLASVSPQRMGSPQRMTHRGATAAATAYGTHGAGGAHWAARAHGIRRRQWGPQRAPAAQGIAAAHPRSHERAIAAVRGIAAVTPCMGVPGSRRRVHPSVCWSGGRLRSWLVAGSVLGGGVSGRAMGMTLLFTCAQGVVHLLGKLAPGAYTCAECTGCISSLAAIEA